MLYPPSGRNPVTRGWPKRRRNHPCRSPAALARSSRGESTPPLRANAAPVRFQLGRRIRERRARDAAPELEHRAAEDDARHLTAAAHEPAKRDREARAEAQRPHRRSPSHSVDWARACRPCFRQALEHAAPTLRRLRVGFVRHVAVSASHRRHPLAALLLPARLLLVSVGAAAAASSSRRCASAAARAPPPLPL